MRNVSNRKKREKQNIVEEIIAESVPNLMEDINTYIKKLNRIHLG